MTAKETIKKVNEAISQSTCSEKEMMQALCEEAEGWKLRLSELEEDEEE